MPSQRYEPIPTPHLDENISLKDFPSSPYSDTTQFPNTTTPTTAPPSFRSRSNSLSSNTNPYTILYPTTSDPALCLYTPTPTTNTTQTPTHDHLLRKIETLTSLLESHSIKYYPDSINDTDERDGSKIQKIAFRRHENYCCGVVAVCVVLFISIAVCVIAVAAIKARNCDCND